MMVAASIVIGSAAFTLGSSLIDIANARASEQLLPIWIRLYGEYQTGDFNFKIVRN